MPSNRIALSGDASPVQAPGPAHRLRDQLVEAGWTRWLDVGSGGNLETGFHYVDTFPEKLIDARVRHRYHRMDIVHAPIHALDVLGKFDLVRLQHLLEHFSVEDGTVALRRAASLLEPRGWLLVSVPDLRIHIAHYLDGTYDRSSFAAWAHNRIATGAPASFYFSVYAHSLPFEPHRWCYDAEGLIHLIASVGLFEQVEVLALDDPRASVPFTHNRPDEDLCVVARRVADEADGHAGPEPGTATTA